MKIENLLKLKTEKVGDCLIWKGAKNDNGYGLVYRNGKRHRVHRFFYRFWVGEIPDGMTLDHLCRNKCCINPKHLEIVSIQENLKRKVSSKTHCIYGHEFTEENTRRYSTDRGKTFNSRACKTCSRKYSREYYKNNLETYKEYQKKYRERHKKNI